MCKILSAVFITLVFSLNLHADDEKAPAHWMELEDTKSNKDSKETFLDETRLLCVSEGYKQITGDTPSHMYLSALALRARVDGRVADRSIRLTKTEEITYKELDVLRKNYLSTVAQHMAMSGACVDGDISDKIDRLDYTNLVKVIDNPDSLKIPAGDDNAGYYNRTTLNSLAQKLTDWDYITKEKDIGDLQKLFPLRTDGKRFTELSYIEKQNLLRISYKTHFKSKNSLTNALDFTPTTSKFVNCYNKIEANRQKGAIKTESRGEKAPSDICRSIQKSCDYESDASFCGGFPEAAQRRPTVCTKPCTKGSGGGSTAGPR